MEPRRVSVEPVKHSKIVALPQEAAFRRFTSEMTEWWPREYTWSDGVLDRLAMEPGEDGLLSEFGPKGFRCDWGRVVLWEPPAQVHFRWQIGYGREPVPDPEKASLVEAKFEPLGGGQTRLVLCHREFERHGEDAADYRQAMASGDGWPAILAAF